MADSLDDLPHNPLVPQIVELSKLPPDNEHYNDKLVTIFDAFASVDTPELVYNLKALGILWRESLRDAMHTEIETYDSVLDDDLKGRTTVEGMLNILDVFINLPEETNKEMPVKLRTKRRRVSGRRCFIQHR